MSAVLSSRVIKRGRIDTLSTVDAVVTKQFLALYQAAFSPLDQLAPARQGLTDDEFSAQMIDEAVHKIVGYDTSDEPVALTFMSSNLATVTWISSPYFLVRFPEHMARHAVFYVGALLVRAAERGGPWAMLIIEEAFRHVALANGMMVFDCCAHNVDRKLPEMIARAARRVCVLDTEELEPQRYFAYTTRGFK